jgi:hypothetical protein
MNNETKSKGMGAMPHAGGVAFRMRVDPYAREVTNSVGNAMVHGGGGAGYAAASTAARLGKRVAMAERGKLGGTCRDFFQHCPILHSNPSGGALPSRSLQHYAGACSRCAWVES